MPTVTKRDRTMRRIVARYLIREVRANSRRSALVELMRLVAHRHRLVYSNDPIPLAQMLPL